MSLRWQAAVRRMRSASVSPAKTGVSQSKISSGDKIEAAPARALLLGEGDQRMARPLVSLRRE